MATGENQQCKQHVERPSMPPQSQFFPFILSQPRMDTARSQERPHLPLLLQLRLAHGAESPVLAARQLRQVPVWGCREPRGHLLPLVGRQAQRSAGQKGSRRVLLLRGDRGLRWQHRRGPQGREAVGVRGSSAGAQRAAGLVEAGGRGVGRALGLPRAVMAVDPVDFVKNNYSCCKIR